MSRRRANDQFEGDGQATQLCVGKLIESASEEMLTFSNFRGLKSELFRLRLRRKHRVDSGTKDESHLLQLELAQRASAVGGVFVDFGSVALR